MEQQKRVAAGQRYLTLAVGNETYAISILQVKEILGMREITPLPQTPASVVGVINLRGTIVPVVDLRIRFGLENPTVTKQTSIVVLDLRNRGDVPWLGLVVDRVHEVQAIEDQRVTGLGGLDARGKAPYLRGVAETSSGLRIIIDVDHILVEEEWTAVGAVTAE